MPREARQLIDLDRLKTTVERALNRKGWTLADLTHELYIAGYPTSHNKLWRLLNKKVTRIDSELLLWLEVVLETRLLPSPGGEVATEEVVVLIREMARALEAGEPPPEPATPDLERIRAALLEMLGGAGASGSVGANRSA